MPALLEPLKRVKCTYKDCYESFDSVEVMKKHKKHSDEHDYCYKCDLDCVDFTSFALHKIIKPDKHNYACRVCGDEFKSKSGYSRHTELSHSVDQNLSCVGCGDSFHRANLFVRHLEYGNCKVISASEFQGHIVHKMLITQLLAGGDIHDRFEQKQAQFEASQDFEEKGGVSLLDDSDAFDEVNYKAIKPDTVIETPLSVINAGPYPRLLSQMASANSNQPDLASSLGGLFLLEDSETPTAVNSPLLSSVAANDAAHGSSTTGSTTAFGSSHQPKVWGSRKGKTASNTLFPDAQLTPVPAEFSIVAHDDAMEQAHGLNIMRKRFWDPLSTDFNPDRFYDAIVNKYHCPFVCEQEFPTKADMVKHIMNDHRVTRIKCPMCLKSYPTVGSLIAHCESRGMNCQINKADDYNIFLDRITGGFLGVREQIHPEHLNNPTVLITNQQTGRIEKFTPPVAIYLQYYVTTPPDWKEPVKATVVGGTPSVAHQQGLYQ